MGEEEEGVAVSGEASEEVTVKESSLHHALSAPCAEAGREGAASGAPQEFAIAGDSPEAELLPHDDEAEHLL